MKIIWFLVLFKRNFSWIKCKFLKKQNGFKMWELNKNLDISVLFETFLTFYSIPRLFGSLFGFDLYLFGLHFFYLKSTYTFYVKIEYSCIVVKFGIARCIS